MFIREGTPRGFNKICKGVPSARKGISACESTREMNNTIRSKEIKKVKKDREEIYKDIEKLGSLGLVEEADRLTKLAQDKGLDWQTYKAICDAMFNPYIIDKDKYIETVLKGNQ